MNWIKRGMDNFIRMLFLNITEQQSHAHIVRFAITFLATWQAIILHYHNYWIPDLIDDATHIPITVYSTGATLFAVISIIAMAFPDALWLSALVLSINSIIYMFLGISSLWYSSPPRASLGFSFFVMLISISAFWRIILLMLRNRVNRKRL